MVATLTMFEVTGTWRAVVAPATSGSTNVPVITVISGTVSLIPRLPEGFLAYVDDYDLGGGVISDVGFALPTVVARINEGLLCTIDVTDAPGIELTAHTDALVGIDELIYDVRFSNVVFNRSDQVLLNFAFTAPTDDSPICLTSPTLPRLAYRPQGTRATRPKAGWAYT